MLYETNITRIPAIHFTYSLWRAGSLLELGIQQREPNIIAHKSDIRKMAVGFTEGYKLHIRPKFDCVAVMFYANDQHFWTHLTIKEFKQCFPEITCIKGTNSLKD